MHAITVLLYALQYVYPLLLGVSSIPLSPNSVNRVGFGFGWLFFCCVFVLVFVFFVVVERGR